MDWNLMFFINSVLFGVGLAMDAFSVSVVNGIAEPDMTKGKRRRVAGTFAGFQAAMPMIGWFLVHTLVSVFSSLEGFIPWIALILLLFLGGKMIIEGIKGDADTESEIGHGALIVQGIATSIDALSVGFTIADYNWVYALVSALIIGAVTYLLCRVALKIGRTVGMKIADKATIVGGIILCAIGIEIFVKGVFFT